MCPTGVTATLVLVDPPTAASPAGLARAAAHAGRPISTALPTPISSARTPRSPTGRDHALPLEETQNRSVGGVLAYQAMPGIWQPHGFLRLRRGRKQRPAELRRNGLVTFTVDDKQRHADARDLLYRVEAVAHQPPDGEQGEIALGHV